MSSRRSGTNLSPIQLNYNGDPQTIWDKINGANGGISDVQDLALKKLETLADKVDAKQKAGTLKKAMKEVEGDVALYLSVLAKCFELQNQFNEIELHKVFVTAPDRFDGPSGSGVLSEGLALLR